VAKLTVPLQFKVPWFRQVLSLGWDFVGRTRKPNFYVPHDNDNWQCISELYKKANKGRHHINRQGLRHASTQSKQHAKGANDPWLLSTSLKQNQTLARRAVAIYKTRMQIEEGFRDMKCQKQGWDSMLVEA